MPLVRFLCHGAERSGPPVYLLRLLQAWTENPAGFSPQLVVARPGELLDEFRRVVPVAVARLEGNSPERRMGRLVASLGAQRSGARLVDEAIRLRAGRLAAAGKPSLTIVNGATAPTAQLLRAISGPERVVMIAHELSTGWLHNVTAAERAYLVDKVAAYLAVSESVSSFLVRVLGVDPASITVVCPPVDVPVKHEVVYRHGDDLPLIVAGGGFTDWRKAPELWLMVARGVQERMAGTPVEFEWFGGAHDGDKDFWPLAVEMRRLGLKRADVRFLGPIEEPAEVYRRASLMVSTAKEDAFPLVCAEAAAWGVPVVTFDSGGAAELVRDAQCGKVVMYPDLEGMIEMTAELLRSPKDRLSLGRSGAAYASAELATRRVAGQVGAWIQGQLK